MLGPAFLQSVLAFRSLEFGSESRVYALNHGWCSPRDS
jgi:hypothetical protein